MNELTDHISESLKQYYPNSKKVTPALIDDIARLVKTVPVFYYAFDSYRENSDENKCPSVKDLKKYIKSGGTPEEIAWQYWFKVVEGFGWEEAVRRVTNLNSSSLTGYDDKTEDAVRAVVFGAGINVHSEKYFGFPAHVQRYLTILQDERDYLAAFDYLANVLKSKRYRNLYNSLQHYSEERLNNYMRNNYWFVRNTFPLVAFDELEF